MSKVTKIRARELLDSRGNPTVEVVIESDNLSASAMVPSGASTGEYEAYELRDKDSKRYLGKGVTKAVKSINETIRTSAMGFETNKQKDWDQLLLDLDGTENKSALGANAILAASLAYSKLSAQVQEVPLYQYFAGLSGQDGKVLPVPMMNIINGGAHANNNLDIQEMMIVPHGFETYSLALRAGVEVFHHLKKVLDHKGLSTAVGDEGGFAPNLKSNAEALDVISQAIQEAGYSVGDEISFAVDVAASEFYQDGVYVLENEESPQKSAEDMVQYYGALKESYPILSIEDGLDENDWDGWQSLTEKLGSQMQLVGDDLFVTNSKLLSKGISQKTANAVLVKMNQIGTITETIDCIETARNAGYGVVISHRSGETEDVSIADLAVGTNAGQIKTGSLCRTDRVAKYNQLLRIEDELGTSAVYKGKQVFPLF